MCSITTKRYIFNFELNRRVPNGMHGGVRGRSKSALLDFGGWCGIRTYVPGKGKCISSAPRYDHFDNPPCYFHHQNPQNRPCKMRRKGGEKTNNIQFSNPRKPLKKAGSHKDAFKKATD